METYFSYKALVSQRSSGYRGTAYALAELIDNALDAEADKVKIIFFEKRGSDQRKYIDEIVVSDNGNGMTTPILETCLQFGSTENDDIGEVVKKRKKGKFGFGLPNASLSQCPMIQVYSKTKKEDWRTTYLDLDEVKKKKSIAIPKAKVTELPKHYLDCGGVLDAKKGTIISWRECDRLSHARAETIIEKSEALLGQLYRHLLKQGKTITLEVWEHQPRKGTFTQTKPAQEVRCNDPLFLLSDTLVSKALFIEANKDGDGASPESNPATYYKKYSISETKCSPTNVLLKDHSFSFQFIWKGTVYEFEIKTSHAHLDIQKPGALREGAKTEVGKFYGQRKSISFVRADREISSDNYGFYKETQPQHRWWGIEVKFNPDADDLLGVHNNKQGIEFWKTDHENIDEEFNEHTATLQQAREKLWIELTKKIHSAYDAAWKIVKTQDDKAKTRNAPSSTSSGSNGLPGSTETTTKATRVTDGERSKRFSPEQRTALAVRLKEKFPDLSDADVTAAIDKYDEWKVQSCILYCAQPGSKTLWSYTEVMGFLVILINTENEFYRNIMMPFRNAQLEAPLAAIELFIGSLANEEHLRFGTKAEAKDILESYRAYVGLHLDRYIKDNDISVSEEDLSRFSQESN